MNNPLRLVSLLFTFLLIACSLPANSMPRDSDDKQFAREKVKIAEMAGKLDIAGLMEMLHSIEFRSDELAAYWLGRLGVKEALPELERLHQQNVGLVCPESSGAFGAAAARIRVADLSPAQQVSELLKLAADTNSDYVLSSEIGRILMDYNDPRIEPALRNTRTYGGQETAVRLETRALPEAKRLPFLVDTLVQHETPQRAEAAQLLLTEAGKAGADAIMSLTKDWSWQKTSPHVRTVENRAYQIVAKVGTPAQRKQLESAGWVWGRPIPKPKPHLDEKKYLDALERLSGSDYIVRYKAALEIRDMPPDVRSLPGLLSIADDSEIIVEREALEALARIDSPQVDPVMLRKLDSPHREFRHLAAETLWSRGYKRPVRVFIADLRDDDPQVRKWADRRLEQLTKRTTEYWYGDPEDQREENVKIWGKWLAAQKR